MCVVRRGPERTMGVVMWADAMRVQVLALHTTLQGVMADESPFKPLALTRCQILMDYIDDLEAGRMPGTAPMSRDDKRACGLIHPGAR